MQMLFQINVIMEEQEISMDAIVEDNEIRRKKKTSPAV